MHIRVPVLAAIVGGSLLGSVANADLIATTIRVPNANITGYDSVMLFVANNGQGVDNGDKTIISLSLTITDTTQAGLVAGLYKSGAAIKGDPYGSSGAMAGAAVNMTGTNGVLPGYGTLSYPTDKSATAAFNVGPDELYSWVGIGGANGNNDPLFNGNNNGTSTFPTSNAPAINSSSTVAANNYGTLLSSYFAEIGWSTSMNADPATAGLANSGLPGAGRGAWVALAVVPQGDSVNFSGTVSGFVVHSDLALNETNAIPEPASLGVLALGGLALLARRRKIA